MAGVRIIGSILYTVENTLVPNLLEKFLAGSLETGAAHSGALAQWGQLKGMAIPVLMFPSTLLAAFVLLLVPELSELQARKAKEQRARQIAWKKRMDAYRKRLEEEKERIRAERRAANPEGQTQNTSKKKLQKQQRDQEAAAKAAAKREYDESKGIFVEEEEAASCMSGIPSRPYCKGRNYDPNRYNSN